MDATRTMGEGGGNTTRLRKPCAECHGAGRPAQARHAAPCVEAGS